MSSSFPEDCGAVKKKVVLRPSFNLSSLLTYLSTSAIFGGNRREVARDTTTADDAAQVAASDEKAVRPFDGAARLSDGLRGAGWSHLDVSIGADGREDVEVDMAESAAGKVRVVHHLTEPAINVRHFWR